ncbi:MAG: hypothetical protein A2275_12735 [Bacteroidetes bacterium RIFOXYA12_FULL_35_11]|nr:MAG: hypothetical protein A2X01_03125 [Bacteroidetes bacterium GWF2_35_48]OFY76501.1 MAG: hypothetical protein A2275_12735 [Bacteroidetes bacterium RIFOXYA12_FULL_35_11]OFY95664.1 MAG: hypothetical protein A2309_05185 [Bacteroidetes bacterium RIFOXYB2_FULL_35_7]OFY99963.1 MAG: hypothetical protein A2491_13165 [Bacteroidetes bacterium RIFOXYC12_FULL_35_7]HBX51414.1 hypothetical protein [Bacteroidales bacterium]
MDKISLIGILAGIFTTIAYFPQAYKIIKTRNTKSISLYMYIILISGISLWVFYGILKEDIPVILANSITLLPALSILFLKIRHK